MGMCKNCSSRNIGETSEEWYQDGYRYVQVTIYCIDCGYIIKTRTSFEKVNPSSDYKKVKSW